MTKQKRRPKKQEHGLLPHDMVAARRALLQLWLDRFRDALVAHQRDKDAHVSAGGGPRDIPPLRLPMPSRDMQSLLLDGIEAALNGSKDPFGIATPRGNPPRLDVGDRIEAVIEIIKEVERTGEVVSAIKNAARKYKVSVETMRNAYYDERILEHAELQRSLFHKDG